MRIPTLLLVLLAPAVAHAAEAAKASYTCNISPDGKSVIMAVTNPNDFAIYCSINCHFNFPGGSASTSCSRPVEAKVTGKELCVKSTGGDKYKLREGTIECFKR